MVFFVIDSPLNKAVQGLYGYVIAHWLMSSVYYRSYAENVHFTEVNGTCLDATDDILELVLFGKELGKRYEVFGNLFQQVICAFMFGFSYYKERLIYLGKKHLMVFLMVGSTVACLLFQ